MDSQNIFDVFGRQVEDFKEVYTRDEISKQVEGVVDSKIKDFKEVYTRDEIPKQVIKLSEGVVDSKIKDFDDKTTKLKDGFQKGFEQFKDHVRKTEELIDATKLTKNYLSLNNKRRIVGVKKGIDKNDVVIKQELNDVMDSLIKLGKEIEDLKKNKTDNKLFEEWKEHIKENANDLAEHRRKYNIFYTETRDAFRSILDKIKTKVEDADGDGEFSS